MIIHDCPMLLNNFLQWDNRCVFRAPLTNALRLVAALFGSRSHKSGTKASCSQLLLQLRRFDQRIPKECQALTITKAYLYTFVTDELRRETKMDVCYCHCLCHDHTEIPQKGSEKRPLKYLNIFNLQIFSTSLHVEAESHIIHLTPFGLAHDAGSWVN